MQVRKYLKFHVNAEELSMDGSSFIEVGGVFFTHLYIIALATGSFWIGKAT